MLRSVKLKGFTITIARFIGNRVAALGVGTLVFICALPPGIAASLFDDNEARRQIAAEKQRIDEVKNDLKSQQTQQQALDARLGRIEETLKSQPLLELFSQIEALKLEINRLRGQIEVLNNNVDNTAKRQRDMYLDLDTRLRRVEQPGNSAPTASASPVTVAPPIVLSSPALPPTITAHPTAAPPASSPPAPTVTGSPATAGVKPAIAAPAAATAVTAVESGVETRAYEAAQSQRRIGNYQGAIVAFQNFIKQYPKSSLAPRAQYWIGDSYFNLRDFKLAIASQQALISNYPDSPTLPDAMLNIASSQIEMGESNAGKKMLEDLVLKFPISEAADKAKRRLAASNAPAATGKQ